MMFGDLPVMLSQIQAGGIVALGVTSQERSPTLPNVPTMAEAGLPGVEAESFYGLMAPAGIPADRLGVLHAALVSALADEQTRRQLVEQGGTVVGNTPEEFSAYINAERAKWGEVVRLSGARLD